jgi:hypothetical protein
MSLDVASTKDMYVGDGELYFSEKEHLLDHLKQLDEWCGVKLKYLFSDDDELLEYFYEQEYYYYTDWWEEIDDVDCYYDAEGNEY